VRSQTKRDKLVLQEWGFCNLAITLKEWTTPDFRNTPSTTNLEGEEIVNAPVKDGNASMLEQVKRPNPWRKMMIISYLALT
jgi:hypothetical protein